MWPHHNCPGRIHEHSEGVGRRDRIPSQKTLMERQSLGSHRERHLMMNPFFRS